jgi:hypothetical protein
MPICLGHHLSVALIFVSQTVFTLTPNYKQKARIQYNHIGCTLLVWVKLKALAAQTSRTVYQLKHGLLDDYPIQQLKNPSLKNGSCVSLI